MADSGRCQECGSPLLGSGSLGGLCPACLLALAQADLHDDTLGEATPTPKVATGSTLEPGRVLGSRYRLLGLVGQGGMGEVWRALDLKLATEVALKALRPELLGQEQSLELLRHEVRAARQVVSPNVCRVFDLVTEDGREMVSMEFVDGSTLAHLLAERGPLELGEAGEIAAQLLAGLDAIHHAGLVHQDLKPGNVMITAARRVVVMDFGLARAVAERRTATVSGTPAYMAPEQAAGWPMDARADVFSAGLVLAEMVSPGAHERGATRSRLWEDLHQDPPRVPPGPWSALLRRALARATEDRFPSARALARALEEVAPRIEVEVTGRSPYPGLATFTEHDAERFFGRELEIEATLRQLRRPRLRAIIGPSGAGKSSFIQAGLLPHLPPGWSAAVGTPGDRPFLALARALAVDSPSEPGPVRLPDAPGPSLLLELARRWRQRHLHVLLVLDQFEELFTLNAPEVQAETAGLLERLVLDADIHVLLSLRDDFLFHCQSYEALRPVFSELMPLAPPTGQALRRALVQPALLSGYRFEDERLVDDMLDEVTHERGALPLLAFAAARLWEARDRERGLLTRRAYQESGGVAGALAQHAEATLEAIGPPRMPIAREILRNLVTAEGTRTVLDQDELLSVFAERKMEAASVLGQLVDARLLTSFELPSEDGDGRGVRRVEIIHESLLTAWPRLVLWRTQDAEGAQLRDQLRQAARLWNDRARPADLLWSGTSLQELLLWRHRYPGRLTAIEEAFTRATFDQAGRRRRRLRLGLAASFVFLLGVVAMTSTLWIKSRAAERRALDGARRGSAQQLFALAQRDPQKNPSEALAYALASLEREDTPAVRLFALRLLWRGPTSFVLGEKSEGRDRWPGPVSFSPDGRSLVGGQHETLEIWQADGSVRRLPAHPGRAVAHFADRGRSLVSVAGDGARLFRLPGLEAAGRIAGSFRWAEPRGAHLITGAIVDADAGGRKRRLLRVFPLAGGAPILESPWWIGNGSGVFAIDPAGDWLLRGEAGDLYEQPLATHGTVEPRRIVHGTDPIRGLQFHPDGDRIFLWLASGECRVWSRTRRLLLETPRPQLTPNTQEPVFDVSTDGRWLASANGADQTASLFQLDGPPEAAPLVLRRGDVSLTFGVAFPPDGRWLSVGDEGALSLWPLARDYPRVLAGPGGQLQGLAFDPHGQWVAAGGNDGQLWIWPLGGGSRHRVVDAGARIVTLTASPDGALLAAGTQRGVWLIPVKGGPPRHLPGFDRLLAGVAFDREGRRVAAGGGLGGAREAVVRVWDLETGAVQVLDPGDGKPIVSVEFLHDGRLVSGGVGGVRVWDLESGRSTDLKDVRGLGPGVAPNRLVSPKGRYVLGHRMTGTPAAPVGTAFVHDTGTGRSWDLASHGDEVTLAAWDLSGAQVITGSRDGTVRTGPFTGEEPHVLMGHDTMVWQVGMDPSGRWIGSASEDGTVRLWPVPAGQPFQALPRAALLARLAALTNYRIVEDPAAPSGYRLTVVPFAGWDRDPPTW